VAFDHVEEVFDHYGEVFLAIYHWPMWGPISLTSFHGNQSILHGIHLTSMIGFHLLNLISMLPFV
jgi:hypothetical protein